MPRLLIANDNEVDNLIAAEIARSSGYEVECVFDGRSAVEACLREAPSLILMDIDMPILGGIEATKELRDLEHEGRLPNIQIIGTSAAMTEFRKSQCRSIGMIATLSKPMDIRILLSAIRSAIEIPQAE